MNSEPLECFVCLTWIKSDERAIMKKCGHMCCINCIKSWIMENPTCPLDRSKVSSVEYYDPDRGTFLEIGISTLIENLFYEGYKDTVTKFCHRCITDLTNIKEYRKQYDGDIQILFKELKGFENDLSCEEMDELSCKSLSRLQSIQEGITKYVTNVTIFDTEKEICLGLGMKFNKYFKYLKKPKEMSDLLQIHMTFTINVQLSKLYIRNKIIFSRLGEILEQFSSQKIRKLQFLEISQTLVSDICVRYKLHNQYNPLNTVLLLEFCEIINLSEYPDLFNGAHQSCIICSSSFKDVNCLECENCGRGICCHCQYSYEIFNEKCFFKCSEKCDFVLKTNNGNEKFVLGKDKCEKYFQEKTQSLVVDCLEQSIYIITLILGIFDEIKKKYPDPAETFKLEDQSLFGILMNIETEKYSLENNYLLNCTLHDKLGIECMKKGWVMDPSSDWAMAKALTGKLMVMLPGLSKEITQCPRISEFVDKTGRKYYDLYNEVLPISLESDKFEELHVIRVGFLTLVMKLRALITK